jgi:uncharacterized protein with HEPN domain
MYLFARRALEYTQGFDQCSFIADRKTYDATIRNLELIGEAATRIPVDIRERFPAIPWRQIIATRNRLIHAYLGIDDDTLWSIITDDIPPMLAELELICRAGA